MLEMYIALGVGAISSLLMIAAYNHIKPRMHQESRTLLHIIDRLPNNAKVVNVISHDTWDHASGETVIVWEARKDNKDE